MPVCKKCGNEESYTGAPCTVCGQVYTATDDEIREYIRLYEKAKEERDYEGLTEYCHFLADMGCTSAELAWGIMLETGDGVDCNLDLAMDYMLRAARKNNKRAAYRYSRLVSREDDAAARFWLFYSAILGCEEAYPETADAFSKSGLFGEANYFYSLAAACNDVGSIVTMAKRYYEGIGTEPSGAYAKWYMDKFTVPPIYAIKLAYKLRRERAEEPPKPVFENYSGFLRRLADEADALGEREAHEVLLGLLAERGETSSMLELAKIMLSDGRESEGLGYVMRAVEAKNSAAHLFLGELYLSGKAVPVSNEKGVEQFILAGEYGSAAGYERAAEVLSSDIGNIKNVALAIELYDKAYALGSISALEKREKIKENRKELYERAKNSTPSEAVKLYLLSSNMDYTPAMLKLAECMRCAIGMKADRKGAFNWYKRAAELGEERAYYPLGKCYAHGVGTPCNFRLAKEWFIRAQRCSDPRAHAAILRLLEGRVKKTAQSLYSKAIRLMYSGKYSLSVKMLEVSAELKHAKAIYTLGCLYEFGFGVPADKERAYAMYDSAYSLRFRDPRSKYKQKILKMAKNIR